MIQLFITWILLLNQLVVPDQSRQDDSGIQIDSIYFLTRNFPHDSLQKKSILNQFKSLSVNDHFIGSNWLCFRLTNPTSEPQSIVLEIESSVYFDLLELYRNDKGSLVSLGITGDPIHHSLRPMKEHGLLFPVTLPPNSTGAYFLHAMSPMEYKLPITIRSKQAFDKAHAANNLLYVFYYGFIVFVFLFSVFLSAIFKLERIYLFYALYLLGLLFLFLHVNGFGYEFLWPDWPEFDRRIPYIGFISSMIFLVRFTEQFLGPGQLKKWEQKVFTLFFYVFCVSLVLSQFIFLDLFFKKVYLFVFVSFLNAIFFIITLIIAFRIYRSGFKPALFYITAFLFLFSSFVFYTIRSMTSIQGWLSLHIVQLGNFVEVMILTLGLAYWFKTIQDDKQKQLEVLSQKQKEMANEKDRIVQDLHDSLGSRLSTISLSLQRVITDTKNESLVPIHEMTNKSMNDLRDSIWALNKESISMEELEQRINSLFWQYRKMNYPISLEMKVIGDIHSIQLTSDAGIQLFRIVQEAVQNSIKHSQAKNLVVTLIQEINFLKLVVNDNGLGFQWPPVSMDDHFGLGHMKKRAEQLGAAFMLYSEPGQGTRISIVVPLTEH